MEMNETQVRVAVAEFASSWPEPPDWQWERSLAAVLRGCTEAEVNATLAELVELSALRPAIYEVVARLESVRRRGTRPLRYASRAQAARGVLLARRALMALEKEPESA
jgi:hypothetical protein